VAARHIGALATQSMRASIDSTQGHGRFRVSRHEPLDPLIDDLHSTLIARNRYRNAIAAKPSVDAADVSD
jgi:hypothetical protein